MSSLPICGNKAVEIIVIYGRLLAQITTFERMNRLEAVIGTVMTLKLLHIKHTEFLSITRSSTIHSSKTQFSKKKN